MIVTMTELGCAHMILDKIQELMSLDEEVGSAVLADFHNGRGAVRKGSRPACKTP